MEATEMFSRFFKTELDEREDIKKAIALLKPQTDKLLAEADAERIQKQCNLLPQLEALKQRRKAEMPALESKARELLEKEEKLRAALHETTKARCAADDELSLRSHWFDHQQNLLRAQIYELAPACIDERQRKWRDQIDEARLTVQAEERVTRPNMFGVVNRIFSSNISNVQRRIDAITHAIKSAEQLKMQPLSETEILRRLDALEAFPPLTSDTEIIKVPAPDISGLQRTAW
jgi:hypothetical protein